MSVRSGEGRAQKNMDMSREANPPTIVDGAAASASVDHALISRQYASAVANVSE